MTIDELTLRTGRKLPAVGIGLWKIDRDQTAAVVETAAACGYRHFDSACDYGNEAEAGEGIKKVLAGGSISREDLWITSKLWNNYHRAEHVRAAAKRSLHDLQLDYLDLYLVHFPIALAYVPMDERYPPGWLNDPDADVPAMKPDNVPIRETWEAMQELVSEGLVRDIGVCNFGVSLLRDLNSYATIKPAVLQIELHPYLTQQKLVRYCRENEIAVTGFSPLGAQSYFSINMAEAGEAVIKQPLIQEIAGRHRHTPAQVLIRWGVQRGTAVVPKTVSESRMRENLAVFDFELTADEMTSIDNLNQNRRYNDPGAFGEAAFNTFFPIYE